MSSPKYTAPYTPNRDIRAMDRAFEAIRDNRITQHETDAGIEYRMDSHPVTESYRRAIRAHIRRGYVSDYELSPGVRQLSL